MDMMQKVWWKEINGLMVEEGWFDASVNSAQAAHQPMRENRIILKEYL